MVRTVIFGSPATGNRFIARSIAKTGGVGYGMTNVRARHPFPSDRGWVLFTHDAYSATVKRQIAAHGATVLGIYRNPLDHVLSQAIYGNPLDPVLLASVAEMRQTAARVPASRRVSYDLLADRSAPGHESERAKLAALVDMDEVVLEPIERTRAALGATEVKFGQPGRWRKVLTNQQARAICAALNEPMPE